jgi:hypothetical protein
MLTDMENNGTQGTQGFIQVQASVRIKTQYPVCIGCIMIACVETPSTLHSIWSVMVVPDPNSISTCPIYKI